jgi:hypothetical protein
VTYERRIALIAATSCVGHGVDLDRRIGQLSTLRNAYSLLHEVAHHRLAYNEANETGMVAFAEASQYFQNLTWFLPAEWPTDFPAAIALPSSLTGKSGTSAGRAAAPAEPARAARR